MIIDVITVTGSVDRTIRMTARGRVVMIIIVGVVRVSVSMSNFCDVMLPMCDVNNCECEVGWSGVWNRYYVRGGGVGYCSWDIG